MPGPVRPHERAAGKRREPAVRSRPRWTGDAFPDHSFRGGQLVQARGDQLGRHLEDLGGVGHQVGRGQVAMSLVGRLVDANLTEGVGLDRSGTRSSCPSKYSCGRTVHAVQAIMIFIHGQVERVGAVAVLAPAQHKDDEHDYHDEDYRPDTDIHRLFLSWQRLVSIADEFLAPFNN